MKQFLASALAGSLLPAIAVLATPNTLLAQPLQGELYSPCQVQGQWFGCRLQLEDVEANKRVYSFRTMGDLANWLVSCSDIKYPNQRTPGKLINNNVINENNLNEYSINCVFNVSTKSERSLSIYFPGKNTPIFTVPTNHNIGR